MKYILYIYAISALIIGSTMQAGGSCCKNESNNSSLPIQQTNQVYNQDSTKIPMIDFGQFKDEEKRGTWGGSFGNDQFEIFSKLSEQQNKLEHQSTEVTGVFIVLRDNCEYEDVFKEIMQKYSGNIVNLSMLEKHMQPSDGLKMSEQSQYGESSSTSIGSSQRSIEQNNKLVKLLQINSVLIYFFQNMRLEEVKQNLQDINGIRDVKNITEYSCSKENIKALADRTASNRTLPKLEVKKVEEHEFPEELNFEDEE